MASPIGGQFIFGTASGQTVVLGINNGSGIAPGPIAGDLNIEVFTALAQSTTTVPAPDTGWDQAAIDFGGTIVNNFLTGHHLILGGGDYMVTDSVTGVSGAFAQSAAEIDAGSGAQTLIGAAGDTLKGGSGDNQILSGLAGPETVAGGSGAESIWGAANSSITGGSGSEQIVITGSGTTVVAGATGSETISLASGDTLTASAGNAVLGIASGGGNLIDLSSNSDNSGGTFVTGGTGDTITAGSGTTQIDAQAGGMSVAVGNGATSVTGSNGTGAGGDTVTGGTGTLDFNPGTAVATGSGDMINLSGSAGGDTINVFSNIADSTAANPLGQLTAVNDTVEASNGADSVWGGPGDVIGAGSVGGAGSGLFDHSTTMPGAVQFGTFDADTTGTSSTATDTVTNFKEGTDSLFYPNETAAENTAIVTAATTDGSGNAVVTFPDGTSMTLVGVSTADLGTLNGLGILFKPA
jgi:hypothetical protein